MRHDMKDDHEELSQIGITLANHFACVYYVDIETGSYHEYVYTESMIFWKSFRMTGQFPWSIG